MQILTLFSWENRKKIFQRVAAEILFSIVSIKDTVLSFIIELYNMPTSKTQSQTVE